MHETMRKLVQALEDKTSHELIMQQYSGDGKSQQASQSQL